MSECQNKKKLSKYNTMGLGIRENTGSYSYLSIKAVWYETVTKSSSASPEFVTEIVEDVWDC